MNILLVYPPLGVFGTYILHPPLSLVYLAVEVVKAGHRVEIFDCRLNDDWRERLVARMGDVDWDLVGVSVMAGLPVKNAAAVAALAREHTTAKVIWGGPYPTIMPEQTLDLPGVDFAMRGFSILALARLADIMFQGPPYDVPGLCYRNGDQKVIPPINAEFEIYGHKDLPYHLIEKDLERYINTSNQRTFPIFTVAGCPYKCAFCICPVWYKGLKKTWVTYPVEDIVEHIRFLHEKWNVGLIYIYDDDSFVNKEHFRRIATRVMEEGINVRFGIRGFRVNELDALDDEDLRFLVKAGITYLHIGAESGSDRVLKIMRKGITVEQIDRINRKLADHHELIPLYNFLSGVPGETMDDLRQTKELMLRLTRENRNAVIFGPAKYIPYPGSKMYEDAVAHGFTTPLDPEGWARLDQETDVVMPWYTPRSHAYINMLFLAAHALDHKERLIENYHWSVRLLYQVCKLVYGPLARLRLRFDYPGMLFERRLYEWVSKVFMHLGSILVKKDVRD